MSNTIKDLIGLPLYARRTVFMRRLPFDQEPIVRTVSPGEMIGVIYSYLSHKAGNNSWYIVFEDPNLPGGNGYVSYDQAALDMPRIKQALDARNEETRRRRLGPNGRALEDAGGVVRDVAETAGANVLTGAMLLGGIYIIGRLFTK